MSQPTRQQWTRGDEASDKIGMDDGLDGIAAPVGPTGSIPSAVSLGAADPWGHHNAHPADPVDDAMPPRAFVHGGRGRVQTPLGGQSTSQLSARSLTATGRSQRNLTDVMSPELQPGDLSEPVASRDKAAADATSPLRPPKLEPEPAPLVERAASADDLWGAVVPRGEADATSPLRLPELEPEPAPLPERATSASANATSRVSYRPRRPRYWASVSDGIVKFRDICGALVNDEHVQLTMIALIVVNAIMMGLATFGFVQDNIQVNEVFQTIDTVFLSIFTIEVGLQLIYHGFRLFLDAWLIFDFCIITLSWSLESLQVVRAFRIFRAVRLIARLDVLRNLLVALFAVAPSMGGIIALLVLIMYIYAVMCTVLFQSLYQDGYTDEDYFGTLFASLFTLFQMMTLDNWASIAREVRVAYSWAWAVFSSYLLMTSFILYSLVIAVVCDAVKVTEHQDEKDEQLREEGELHERVMLLEKLIMEMAGKQFTIVQNLTTALEILESLEGDGNDDIYDALSADSDTEVVFPAGEVNSNYGGSARSAHDPTTSRI